MIVWRVHTVVFIPACQVLMIHVNKVHIVYNLIKLKAPLSKNGLCVICNAAIQEVFQNVIVLLGYKGPNKFGMFVIQSQNRFGPIVTRAQT